MQAAPESISSGAARASVAEEASFPGLDADPVAAQAVASGLPVVATSAFATDPTSEIQALRISLGGSAPRWRVRREIARLEALVADAGRRSIV